MKDYEILSNWTGMDKERNLATPIQKRFMFKDVTSHTPSHTWNTETNALFMSIDREWKGLLLWAPMNYSMQAFFELKRPLMLILHKVAFCHLFSLRMVAKSFDRHYFINVQWPQWELQLYSLCGMCPSFHSSTCAVCVHMHVCKWHQYIRGILSWCAL